MLTPNGHGTDIQKATLIARTGHHCALSVTNLSYSGFQLLSVSVKTFLAVVRGLVGYRFQRW